MTLSSADVLNNIPSNTFRLVLFGVDTKVSKCVRDYPTLEKASRVASRLNKRRGLLEDMYLIFDHNRQLVFGDINRRFVPVAA
jgi:hypothetical protein